MCNKWLRLYLEDRQRSCSYKQYNYWYKSRLSGSATGLGVWPTIIHNILNDLNYTGMSSNLQIVYADDINFCLKSSPNEDSITYASTSAQKFYNYYCNLGISLNISKTNFMRFLPKNVNQYLSLRIIENQGLIQKTSTTTFLGVIVHHKMTWEQHIHNVVTKWSSICFLIRQLRNTVSIDILRMVYHAHVQFVLSYGLFGVLRHICMMLSLCRQKFLHHIQYFNLPKLLHFHKEVSCYLS